MNATLSNKTKSLSGSLILMKDLEIFVEFTLTYSAHNSGNFKLEFMNRTVDACKFLHNPRYELLLQILYKIMLQKGHLPQRCPVKKVLKILLPLLLLIIIFLRSYYRMFCITYLS